MDLSMKKNRAPDTSQSYNIIPQGYSLDGKYYPKQLEVLTSKTSKYEVLKSLGSGVYGQVVKCREVGSGRPVAVKILRNESSYVLQGLKELDILTNLKKNNATYFYMVELLDSFFKNGHLFLVFENLQIDLYEFMKQRDYLPLPLDWIKPVTAQLLLALSKLKSLSIIHTDIKPDNVMLAEPVRHPFKIKLIDFGCAATIADRHNNLVQSLYYRSPEVILGLPFDEAIDMWSVGCVLLELYLGWPFFSGDCEYDVLRCICDVLQVPNDDFLNRAPNSEQFFKWDQKRRYWRLKTVVEYEKETGVKSVDYRKVAVASLYDVINLVSWSELPRFLHVRESARFVHLVERMLATDPKERITPAESMGHVFLTNSRY